MKALVWVLNIIQFLIAYFISYALYFYGILELLPPETGLIGKGVWPAAAIGMALLPWKYYNRLSNYIIAQTTNIKAPKTNISNMSKPKPSKLLYTFFFGYAALKWRRLIRTLIILATIACLFFLQASFTFTKTQTIIASYIAIGLISWLIKPFVVKEG
mgnify:CR=1 FL=1|tara:strand:- start:45 stop:518 length:474 start_codon:yes stop_codon:yes gene_type:complete